MQDIITIGSTTFDVFVTASAIKVVDSNDFATGKSECFAYGSKVEVDDVFTNSGGGASNASATFANLGLKTQLVSRIGDDAIGDLLFKELKSRGMDTRYIARSTTARTPYSTILSAPGKDRTILVYRGAFEEFSSHDIPQRLNASWVYVSSLLGKMSLAREVFTKRVTSTTKTFWNPGARELERGLTVLTPILRTIDVLNVNEEEASLLTGLPMKSMKDMAIALRKTGVSSVVITHGARGATYMDDQHMVFSPTWKVSVVNRTGAGDAFGAGFVSGMIQFNNPLTALRMGMLNSSGVIQVMGAKNGLLQKYPTQKQLSVVRIQKL